jgi:hypothetical protein
MDTTASAGAVLGCFGCHAAFLSEIKSGAIWQITKNLSIMNFVIEKNMDFSCRSQESGARSQN